MKILDRLLIRTFAINYAVIFAVLVSMYVVVSLVVDLDEFVAAGSVRAPAWGGWRVVGTLAVVLDFYLPQVALLFVYASGIVAVGAAGFTFMAMQRNRELTALVASGVSLYRVAAPVVVAGVALSSLALPVQELLIPPLASRLLRRPNQLKEPDHGPRPVLMANDPDRGLLLNAATFRPDLGQLEGVRIIERNDVGVLRREVTAHAAQWLPELGGWRLTQGYALEPAADFSPVPAAQPDPTPVDFVSTRLSPTVLLARQATDYPALLPLRRLQEMQRNAAVPVLQRRAIASILWGRFSLLAVNALVLVLALPLLLSRTPGRPLMQGLLAAGSTLGAWGGALLALQVQTPLLPPAVSAWLSVAVLLPMAAVALTRIRT